MATLTFRGISSASLGDVYIQKMPSHKKAAMRYTEYKVKGRDGTLHVNEGFDSFDIMATIVLINATASKRQTVNAWADGTGKLILSDDTTKAYRARVLREIVWTRDLGNGGFYDIAKITFTCDPFMYEAVDTVLQYTANATLVNPGSAEALPLIKVEGSGDASFAIDGETISISGMTSGVPVYIDCETGYVYTEQGATEMTGEIPVLRMTPSIANPITITLGSGVTKLTITPHWRWV